MLYPRHPSTLSQEFLDEEETPQPHNCYYRVARVLTKMPGACILLFYVCTVALLAISPSAPDVHACVRA
jgi:hypothetical protein